MEWLLENFKNSDENMENKMPKQTLTLLDFAQFTQKVWWSFTCRLTTLPGALHRS